MKKILVPTDFSTVADNAFEHALGIAEVLGSELYLYHTYQLHKIDYHKDFPAHQQPETEKRLRLMEGKKVMFMNDIRDKNIRLHTFVERESVSALFGEIVERHGLDMIVMGSSGASGLRRFLIGSVATTAIEEASVPVMIIPSQHHYRPIKKIVLAIDREEIDARVLYFIRNLAVKFGASITIITVYKKSSGLHHDIRTLAIEGVEVAYEELILNSNVNKTITEYIQNNDCDLLCMIRREKDFFQNFFESSITKKQAYDSEIPLLILSE